jgi:hypothetical protein
VSFSTPRAWAALSKAMDLAAARNMLTPWLRRALAFGRLSARDASVFCAMAEERIDRLKPYPHYIAHPEELPDGETARWFILGRIRSLVQQDRLAGVTPGTVNHFLRTLSPEHRCALVVDLVKEWGDLGARPVMREMLKEVTGI